MIRDLAFSDQTADICAIKKQVGHTICEVFADA
jgi:hypothetical protein